MTYYIAYINADNAVTNLVVLDAETEDDAKVELVTLNLNGDLPELADGADFEAVALVNIEDIATETLALV